jgi:prepilin-type N-terminal cleavage/methylation domain-containing protein
MKPNSRAAFTLVEVLVVIAITSLLAGLILSYSSTSRDRVALSVQQAKLSQTIAKAKALTISTYNQPAVPCGYGVRFDYDGADANTYKLFSYDAPQCDNITVLDPAFETEIVTETLPASLNFEAPDSESITEILFLPPNPDTWIWLNDANGTSTNGRVPLTAKSGSFAVYVLVSSAGQISF